VVCERSRGTQLQVTLTYAQDLTVRVADNGVGIRSSIGEHGKEGHFGLRGMRERANRIDAKLTIASTSSGTEVKLVVPGKAIYRKAGWLASGKRRREPQHRPPPG
jgi:signal transduction histidine kinase